MKKLQLQEMETEQKVAVAATTKCQGDRKSDKTKPA